MELKLLDAKFSLLADPKRMMLLDFSAFTMNHLVHIT